MPARSIPHVACLGLLLAGAAPPQAPAPAAPPPADGAAIHVSLETFVIRSQRDLERGLRRGRSPSRARRRPAKVDHARGPRQGQDAGQGDGEGALHPRRGAAAGGAVCFAARRIRDPTRRGRAGGRARIGRVGREDGEDRGRGPVDRRDALVTLAVGEERLLDVYASPLNNGRVAMRVRCAPSRAETKAVPDMLALDLSVQKDGEDEPAEILRSQRLLAPWVTRPARWSPRTPPFRCRGRVEALSAGKRSI